MNIDANRHTHTDSACDDAPLPEHENEAHVRTSASTRVRRSAVSRAKISAADG